MWYVLFSLSGFTEELLEFAKKREDLVLLGEAEDEWIMSCHVCGSSFLRKKVRAEVSG